jgi:phosphatidate cytidylyltransferase
VRPDLAKRLAVAGVGVPLCALVTYVGGWVFAVGLGVVAAIGFSEYGAMMRGAGGHVFGPLGAMAAFLYPIVVYYGQFHGAALYGGAVLLGFAALSVWQVPLDERPLVAAALTVFGILYVGGLLGFAVPIREGWFMNQPENPGAPNRIARTIFFFFPLVVTWIADTAAYFGGRTFGKRKLSPVISPNKTVEGAVAALIGATLAAVAYSLWVLPTAWKLDWLPAAAFGVTVGLFAIIGDLVESALKRECGVKDSSNLLPGHGGMLDRLDSILWALPTAFFYMALLK